MAVRFVLNGKPAQLGEVDLHLNLLTWLRQAGFTGSKEGCAEGECGACAVALVEPDDEHVSRLVPVNSCLLPAAAVAGRHVITVEGVAGDEGALHPVQQAMIHSGGSQCGYCTPGFVISLFCEFHRPNRSGFDLECVSGNLCRCTGYRPIRDAVRALSTTTPKDRRLPILEQTGSEPALLDQNVESCATRGASCARFVRPTTLEQVFHELAVEPGARVIAGGTDLMVDVNQRDVRVPALISLEGVPELRALRQTDGLFEIGASAPLSLVEAWLQREARALPLFGQLMPLFASPLIRNRATLGGSLATASPIGDIAPVLLALDAELVIGSVRGERILPVREFFRGYRQSALEAGELLVRVRIAAPTPEAHGRFYKVSKRTLDDISTVAAAFCLELDSTERIRQLRAGYAGIAAVPVGLDLAGADYLGKPWDDDTRAAIRRELDTLGTPIDDRRGSAPYRRAMVTRLFERFCADISEGHPGAPGRLAASSVAPSRAP